MHLRALTGGAFAFVAVALVTCPASASSSVGQCLEQADRWLVGKAVRETFGSSPAAGYDDIVADARGVVWRLRPPRDRLGDARYAVAFDGSDNCWIGGKIVGTGKPSRIAPSALAVGTAYPTSNSEIHSLEISNSFNGIWVGSATVDLRLTNVLWTETADTCLVAAQQGEIIVDNGFFHKCARVVKWQGGEPGSSLTIRNSLIRINNRRGVRTRGRLFNSRALSAKAEIYFADNVVVTTTRLDRSSLAVIEANCTDNTLIWLGEGEYPGDLPDCFTVVTGKKAWRAARLAWMKQHQRQLAELGKDPDADGDTPPPSACTLPEVPDSISPIRTVGTGSAASCTESALRGALAGGGTITFSCGASPVTIPIGSELVVSRPTVLDGGGTVTLDGQDRTSIIRNDSQLTLKAITLARGRKDVVWNGAPNGGGAVSTTYGHRLYVVDSTFTGNRTSAQGFGGAIFQAGAGALTVVRSRFENNVGGGGGAIYNLLAGLQVVDSTFVRNQGSSGWQGGGGIMTDGASANSGNGGSGGAIVVCGSRFDANRALATGGGAYLYAYGRDTVTVTRSTFSANSVTPNSGGLSMGGGVRFGPSPALVSDSTFRNNAASMGGAIATEGKAQTRVKNSTFACNSSDIEGGNVLAEGNDMQGC